MELIDVGPLKEQIDKDVKEGKVLDGWAFFFKVYLDNAPVINIVRCKECKHRINDDDFQEKHICLLRRANGGKFCRDNDFCSYGE